MTGAELGLIGLGCVVGALIINEWWWRRRLKEWNWSASETIRILTNKVQRLEEKK